MPKIIVLAVALCFVFVALAVEASAKTAGGPGDGLLPSPRKIRWLPGALPLTGNVNLLISASASKGTASTADLFSDDLKKTAGLRAQVATEARGSGLVINLQAGRRRGAAADRYRLIVGPGGVSIYGAGESGLFYGTRTFLQLVQGKKVGETVPCCQIEDWPDYRYRMVHYDLAREQTTNMAYLKMVIDRLSYYKINMLKLYFENRFQFEKHPKISPPGSMTAAQAKELDEYARKRFVELVPEVNTLGHMEHALAVPEYRHLAEDQNAPYELCASSAEGKKLVSDMIAEVAAPFKSHFIHVGGDETSQTGTCPICSEQAKKIGMSGLYINHFLAIHKMAKARGKRMMMWGDMLLAHKDLVDLLPKDIIIFDWHYENSTKSTVEFFRRKGFEVFVCPAMSGFGRIAAPHSHATDNIHTFIGQGSEAGAIGECTCSWEVKMGHLFENDAFGIILSADRSWNMSCDIKDFNRRFCKSYFGLDDTRPIDCYRMVSDGFAEMCDEILGGYSNRAMFHLHGPDEIAQAYGDKASQGLLDKVMKHQKKTLDLIASVRHDCARNRDALDFLDMPTYGWVHAVKRTLLYKQADDLIKAAREEGETNPASAGEKLAKAESLLDQILADLPYFEKRFKEAVQRFGGSEVDLQRIAGNKARIEERKAEIAALRKERLQTAR